MNSRLRVLIACLATAVLVVPLAWFWQASLLPDTYSVMNMGYLDYGGGPEPAQPAHGHAGHSAGQVAAHAGPHSPGGRSVDDLAADPDRPADVRVEIVARE